MSRSTWACELKSFYSDRETKITRHAPRERVSWNVILSLLTKNFWKVTLHVSVWVEIWIFLRWNQFIASRSTWACELKYLVSCLFFLSCRHAPRERVSWNNRNRIFRGGKSVTLHVSVWVEILGGITYGKIHRVTLHVSVWVEILIAGTLSFGIASHAPRERVSWNILEEKEKNSSAGSRSTWACELKFCGWGYPLTFTCHAPRERVSWNFEMF